MSRKNAAPHPEDPKSSQHLLGLINDILDMSKIESSEVKLNEDPVDLMEQVAQIDSIICPQAEERGQEFKIHVHGIDHGHLLGESCAPAPDLYQSAVQCC